MRREIQTNEADGGVLRQPILTLALVLLTLVLGSEGTWASPPSSICKGTVGIRAQDPPKPDQDVDYGDDEDDEDDEADEDEDDRPSPATRTVKKPVKGPVKPQPAVKRPDVKKVVVKPVSRPKVVTPAAKPPAVKNRSAKRPTEPASKPSIAKPVVKPAVSKSAVKPRVAKPISKPPAAKPIAVKTLRKKTVKNAILNRTPKWFIKGDLAAIGALGLVPWGHRIGGRVDIERLGPLFYVTLTPTVNYTLRINKRDMSMSFGVPLRLQLLDTRGIDADEKWADAGRFRKEDWDTPQDFVKLIRFFTYGRKEDHFYFNINAFRTATIGHGTLLKRYNPNLSIDIQRVSVELDGFTDYIGAQTYLNNIGGPNLAGALVFFKPLSLVNRSSYVLRSFSIGAHVVVDWDAPMVNRLDIFDEDKDGRRGEILLGGSNVQPQYTPTTIVGYGFDLETKIYKSPKKSFDLKAYLDVSFLTASIPKACEKWADGADKQKCAVLFSNDPVMVAAQPDNIETEQVTSNGVALGLLGRFTLGEKRNHALRLRLEFRSYAPNFLPSYFDTFYQVERVQYRNSRDPLATNPANQSKVRRILGREGDDRVFGVQMEASYALWNVVEASIGFSFNSQTSDNGFYLHLGVPRNRYFSFALTYYKSSSHAGDLLKLTDNALFIFQGRAFVLPFLHVYLGAVTPFGYGEDNQYRQIFDVTAGLEFFFKY
jgi:hypothetical protein